MTGFEIETWTRPAVLPFVVPAVLFVAVTAIASRAPLGRAARAATALTRSVLVAVALLALAGPSTLTTVSVPGRVAFLFDVSRSISRADREAAVAHARGVLAGRDPSCAVTVAAFADGERVLFDGVAADLDVDAVLAEVASGAGVDGLASDPTRAMTALYGREREGECVVRWIYTDGALPSPPRLGTPGGRTVFVPAHGAEVRNTSVVAVESPARVIEDEPLALTVFCDATVSEAVSLELVVDGVVRRTVDAALEPGERRIDFESLDLGLAPGRHEIVARLATPDDEPLDDAAAAVVDVLPERHVLYVRGEHRGEREPAFERALRAQGVELRTADGLASADWERVAAVVLDRVPPEAVGAGAAAELKRHVRAGGGLLVFPREDAGELMRWNSSALAALLPLSGIPAPPPPEADEEKEEKKEDEPPPKKTEADPDREKVEEIDAPTLVMMIVVDKSRSMKDDSRLHYAKRAAIATARKLHPEDRIGVISYNDAPTEVVPVRPAGDRAEIERAIERIRPSGGTHIGAALEFAKDTLDREDAAIKTIILLSDGETRPFNIKGVAESLVASGISINTVGVGSSFNVATLTLIAKYGHGTGPIPARRSGELPAILVDVASRIMRKHGTRTADDAKKDEAADDEIVRPEIPDALDARPKRPAAAAAAEETARPVVVGRFVSYLAGIPWDLSPRLSGLHLSAAKDGAWVSLTTEPPAPVLAHWRVGDGAVAMASIPPEGAWSRDLSLWDAYAPWASQLVRFLSRDPALERYDVGARFEDDRVRVGIVDTWSRTEATGWTFAAAGDDLAAEELGEGRFLVTLPARPDGPIVHLEARSPEGERVDVAVPSRPPLEVRARGLDLGRLEEWRRAVGGELGGAETPAPTDGERVEARLALGPLLLILVAVFVLDLVLKRVTRRET